VDGRAAHIAIRPTAPTYNALFTGAAVRAARTPEVCVTTILDAPLDLDVRNRFASLPDAFYSRQPPAPLSDPWLVHANVDAARLIDLDPEALRSRAFLDVFSGRAPLPGGDPLAAVYSGHQFGVWAGQLGDGRALLLGEAVGPDGGWELQLKGSGRTPYSRGADGRAVLRSSIREYLASEAMFALGIPTTRALAITASDDRVRRETMETAAVVTRMAPSFIRFGSFEHWASRREPERLRELADFVITNYYPECLTPPAGEADVPNGKYLRWLGEVVRRTARLMADWQLVGFCHGVMNTDNMSILGLTLDYGPYGFMDGFDAHHICNHSDHSGRYAWDAQPSIAHWNLYALGSSLMPLLDNDEEALRAQLDQFEEVFLGALYEKARAKLGLLDWREGDPALLNSLWGLMHNARADFTQSFRRLAKVRIDDDAPAPEGETFRDLFIDREAADAWLATYQARLRIDGRPDAERAAAMNRVNPIYVLRNHLAELAIRGAQQRDTAPLEGLLDALRDPFTERPGLEQYASLPPDWASDISVSCSS
jgi:uncharacterized protein YdiU (UPF0061 family)